MNDHARELRRYASVLGRPTIMLDAADEIERLAAKLEAAEKERDDLRTELNEIRYGVAVAHDTIKALRAKIEAMEKQEPVEWQSRTRPVWNNGTWTQWSQCSKGYAEDIKKTPLLHDWLYETRALYALPGAQGEKK